MSAESEIPLDKNGSKSYHCICVSLRRLSDVLVWGDSQWVHYLH